MLSTEQFSQIVALIQTTTDAGDKSVRRAPRISHSANTLIELGSRDNPQPPCMVEITDISARGMSFIFDREMPAGSVFVTKLKAPDGTFVSILTTVVHCRPRDDGRFHLGVEYTCTLGKPPEIHIEPTAEDLMHIQHSILD